MAPKSIKNLTENRTEEKVGKNRRKSSPRDVGQIPRMPRDTTFGIPDPPGRRPIDIMIYQYYKTWDLA
jgi:hypothetical protein